MASAQFPFGQPVLPRSPSATGHRPVYVLGAYPSGLHVHWTPPVLNGERRKPIRAMLVDNEPTPFWSGSGETDYIEDWKRRVGWRAEWGQASPPSKGSNGPSGAWVDMSILAPLGFSRDEACISDCLDTARLNTNQEARIRDTYAPVAEQLGLPECSVRPVPAGRPGSSKRRTRGTLRGYAPRSLPAGRTSW